MSNTWVLVGAISGFITVALGAFGAHGLKELLKTNHTTDIFNKAVLYQMFHTIALLIVGILEISTQKSMFLSGLFFTTGILIFSGSLYFLAITNLTWLGAVTPIGGICFLAGWVCLIWYITH